MKKSALIVLFLAAMAFLGGCVHPMDLESIAPQQAKANTQR